MMVSVEVAVPPLAGETDAGEKLQVEPFGCPEQPSVTAELKPLSPPSVTVKEADCPAAIVLVIGDALMLKSEVGAGAGSWSSGNFGNQPVKGWSRLIAR